MYDILLIEKIIIESLANCNMLSEAKLIKYSNMARRNRNKAVINYLRSIQLADLK